MSKHLLILFASAIYLIAATQPTNYTYKKVGNLTIQAAVYLPNTTSHDKHPVVLAIHGGGYLAGRTQTGFSAQELAEMLARGWAVVSIDYRLSPYVFLRDIVEDVEDAYNWIRNDLVNVVSINPDAIAVWGDSAGGGLAVISGFKVTPRPKAIIAFYPYYTNFTDSYAYNPSTPVSDSLVELVNSLRQPLTEYIPLPTDDPRQTLFNTVQAEEKAGWMFTTSDPNESPEVILSELRDLSVVNHIDGNYPPTYLIHGLNDTIVPYAQSVEMAQQLESQNVAYQLDLVPGAGHAFDFVTLSQEMWDEHMVPIFEFTEKYIGKSTSSKFEILA